MGVRVIDRGLNKLLSVFTGKQKTRITVGIHAVDGKEPHAGGQFGETVADIAALSEFGAPGIPQRSFLRAWFDENQAKTKEATKRMAQSVLKGKRTRAQAIELLAQSFVGQIQRRIAQGIAPPNSPITIALKGSSTPIIETGQVRSAITYAIDGAIKESKAAVKRKAAKKKARSKQIKQIKKQARQAFRKTKRQAQRAARRITKSFRGKKRRT